LINFLLHIKFLQKSLDNTAAETGQRQDEAEKGKKVLIELTKEWRKTTDEVILWMYCSDSRCR